MNTKHARSCDEEREHERWREIEHEGNDKRWRYEREETMREASAREKK